MLASRAATGMLEVLAVSYTHLHPSNTGYPIDGDYYEQIIKYANDHKILIELHSYPREKLLDDVCSPARIRNVVGKYSNLRLSIAHLGGFQYEELYGLNAYFNLSAVLPDLVDRMGIENTNIVLRSLGVEKLVFATDYPDSRSIRAIEIYDTYCDILGQMDFTQEEAENICKYNALKMCIRDRHYRYCKGKVKFCQSGRCSAKLVEKSWNIRISVCMGTNI